MSIPDGTSVGLALRYSLFAGLAILANLLAQMAFGQVYQGPGELWASLAVGTLVGLVVKYSLDKRWIFSFPVRDLEHDAITFMTYGTTGLVTTAIFWGTEWLFDWIFATHEMRYLGGALGLSAGYMLKYRLDRRYTFAVRSR